MSGPGQPSLARIDLGTGVISDATEISERHLSDMAGAYQDQQAAQELLKPRESGDPGPKALDSRFRGNERSMVAIQSERIRL